MLEKYKNDYINRLLDEVSHKILMKYKNNHLYVRHPRIRQIENCKKLRNGRTTKRNRIPYDEWESY